MDHMRKPSRLADIARECGVSTAAVSRILNGDRRFSVRPEVRQHVQETAHRLGYVPDLSARNLNRRKTGIVGMFGSPYTNLGHGINQQILDGVARTLHRCDYDLFFEVTRRQPGASPLPFWRFDGAILLQAPQPQIVEELERRQVPYVCVNEKTGKPAAIVLTDDVHGMELALEHLHALGHHTIAYANARSSYFPHYSIAERHSTLLAWAKRHKVTLARGHDRPCDLPEVFLREAVLEDHATAVIVYDHMLAVAILGAAQTLGLAIPHDLSLVCFNDEFPVGQLYPGLTAIAVAGHQMGQLAADCMLKAIASPATTEPAVLTVPESLIVRGSTAAPKHTAK
jgi:LacI family transcriptional regulator